MTKSIFLDRQVPLNLWGKVTPQLQLTVPNWFNKIGHTVNAHLPTMRALTGISICSDELKFGLNDPLRISLHCATDAPMARFIYSAQLARAINSAGIPKEWITRNYRSQDEASQEKPVVEVRIPRKHLDLSAAENGIIPGLELSLPEKLITPAFVDVDSEPSETVTEHELQAVLKYQNLPAQGRLIPEDLALEAVKSFLSDKQVVTNILSRLKINLTRDSRLTLRLAEDCKHGDFAYVQHWVMQADKVQYHLAVNFPRYLGPRSDIIGQDYNMFNYYWNSGLRKYIPEPLYGTPAHILSPSASALNLFTFAVRWLSGYEELHVVDNIAGNHFLLWHYDAGKGIDEYEELAPLPSDRIAEKIVEILTYHYLPEKQFALGIVRVNAGDFVYRRSPTNDPQIKLITLRGVKNDVNIPAFLHQLFYLYAIDYESLAQPHTGETMLCKPVRVTTPRIVFNGLTRGLSDPQKFGTKGKQMAIQWMRQFAQSELGAPFQDEIGQILG